MACADGVQVSNLLAAPAAEDKVFILFNIGHLSFSLKQVIAGARETTLESSLE